MEMKQKGAYTFISYYYYQFQPALSVLFKFFPVLDKRKQKTLQQIQTKKFQPDKETAVKPQITSDVTTKDTHHGKVTPLLKQTGMKKKKKKGRINK